MNTAHLQHVKTWMDRCNAGALNGALVTIRELCELCGMNAASLGRIIDPLIKAGCLYAHRHDFPKSIKADQAGWYWDTNTTDDLGRKVVVVGLVIARDYRN